MFERLWKSTLRRQGISLWSIQATVCWLLSVIYSLCARINRAWPRTKIRVGVPVISIGNVAVGGSGKTPLVIAIADALQKRGYRIGIVARGYGRSGNDAVVLSGSELAKLPAEEVGDEVLLMGEKLPTAIFSIHHVKAEAARKLASECSVDLIIVDDGFQHFRLHRDLEIVAVDASIPSNWLHPLPYGVLREPLSALRLADLVVMTRTNIAVNPSGAVSAIDTHAASAQRFEVRFLNSKLVGNSQSHTIEYLRDKSVALFAGIGNFDALKSQVQRLAGTLVAAIELSDHQRYDEATVTRVKQAITQYSPQIILTTAKDWVKVRHFDFGPEFYYLDLQLEFTPPVEQLTSFIVDRLELKQRTQ